MEKTCQSCLTLCALLNNHLLSHWGDDGKSSLWSLLGGVSSCDLVDKLEMDRQTRSGSLGRLRKTSSEIRKITNVVPMFYFHKVWCRLQLCHWLLASKPEHHGPCTGGIWRDLSGLEDACLSFQGQTKEEAEFLSQSCRRWSPRTVSFSLFQLESLQGSCQDDGMLWPWGKL